jgi:hypothetical protein
VVFDEDGVAKSGWTQAGIAFAISAVSSACVAIHVNESHFAIHALEHPHHCRGGLSALMAPIQAGYITLVCVFAVTFIVQRLLADSSRPD